MTTVNIFPSADCSISRHNQYGYYIYQDGSRQIATIGSWDWYGQQWSGWYATQGRALFKFPLNLNLPANAVITKAKFVGWLYKADSLHDWNRNYRSTNQTPTLDVHRVTNNWDEGRGTGFNDGYQYTGATWTNRTAGGWGWSNSGGDIDWTPSASITLNHPNGQYAEWDVTDLVRWWINNPSQNYGLMVKYRNDGSNQGCFDFISREQWRGNQWENWVAHLEITYSTPPEKPRGLSPNFNSFISNDLAHTTHFKWQFIDTAAPIARAKSDVVFMVDVSNSMTWNLPAHRISINNYIDRLDKEGVDYQVGLVTFADVNNGDPINREGWFRNKNDLINAYDRASRKSDGDWPESGLEAIMDGALAFTWRSDAKKHLIVCTDAPFHGADGVDGYYRNYSKYRQVDVIQRLKDNAIPVTMCTNTHCASYSQLIDFPWQTGGNYYDEGANWGYYAQIFASAPSADQSKAYDEGDYQTRADINIWKIEGNGGRTFIKTVVINGNNNEWIMKGENIAWEEGASYEWSVTVYDSTGLASPPSDRAKFIYRTEPNALVGIPYFNSYPAAGTTIRKSALTEIRGKMYDEVRKYRNLNPEQVLTLFNGEVVPSKRDMIRLRDIMNQMLVSDGLKPMSDDLLFGNTFSVRTIRYIQSKLVEVAYSPPDTPSAGTAQSSIGRLERPGSIVATHTSTTDRNLTIKWTPAEMSPSGWMVTLNAAKDSDINYYKFYWEEQINLTNTSKRWINETYITSEQVGNGGTIFVPWTGRDDWQNMFYTAHDMNGRTSGYSAPVAINWNTVGTGQRSVSAYEVQIQLRSWTANIPDPNSWAWFGVYYGPSTSFTYNGGLNGSYWFRVRAVDNTGAKTDWTYSTAYVYIN